MERYPGHVAAGHAEHPALGGKHVRVRRGRIRRSGSAPPLGRRAKQPGGPPGVSTRICGRVARLHRVRRARQLGQRLGTGVSCPVCKQRTLRDPKDKGASRRPGRSSGCERGQERVRRGHEPRAAHAPHGDSRASQHLHGLRPRRCDRGARPPGARVSCIASWGRKRHS